MGKINFFVSIHLKCFNVITTKGSKRERLMKVNKKAAFSCSVPLDGEDVVVSSSSRGFCAFCRLLGNPLMPDLVIDRALGYVNLLLLLFFFLAGFPL